MWWPRGFSISILNKGNQGASLPRNQNYDDQGAFLPRNWNIEMLIKGLLYFDLNCWNVDQRVFLLRFELLKCRLKDFSTSIWIVEMSIKGLFYFDQSCWNVDQRVFWSCCWNVNQRAFLLQYKMLKCRSKGFSSTWTVEISIKGLFYIDWSC